MVASLVLPTPGSSAEWGSTVNAALTAINDEQNAQGVWEDYTPAYNYNPGTTGVVREGRWCEVNDLIHFWARLKLGTGFSIGSAPTLGLPVTARTITDGSVVNATFLDSGTATYMALGLRSTTAVTFWIPGTNGAISAVGAAAPFTWVAGDVLFAQGFYEPA